MNPLVKISFDIFCDKFQGDPPVYRLWVNDELFVERTYIWQGSDYVNETIQMDAPPGEYEISLEKIGKCKLRIRNTMVEHGPAEMIEHTRFKIHESN